MTKRDKVESVAQSILAAVDDLTHLQCPQCGKRSLLAEIHDGAVTVVCKTPLALNPDDNETWLNCAFFIVVSGVDISAGVFNLEFAAERPVRPPIRTKRTRKPRSKQVRKTR